MNNLMRVLENGYFQFSAATLELAIRDGRRRNLGDVMSTMLVRRQISTPGISIVLLRYDDIAFSALMMNSSN